MATTRAASIPAHPAVPPTPQCPSVRPEPNITPGSPTCEPQGRNKQVPALAIPQPSLPSRSVTSCTTPRLALRGGSASQPAQARHIKTTHAIPLRRSRRRLDQRSCLILVPTVPLHHLAMRGLGIDPSQTTSRGLMRGGVEQAPFSPSASAVLSSFPFRQERYHGALLDLR